MAEPQRRLRRRAENLYTAIKKVGKKVTDATRAGGQGRGGGARAAATGQPRPGDHHGRDRPGGDERGGHRHRGGARQADRRDRRRDPVTERGARSQQRSLTPPGGYTGPQSPAWSAEQGRLGRPCTPEDPIPCNFVSSPISRGTCPRMSSSFPWRRPPSTVPRRARPARRWRAPGARRVRGAARQALRRGAGVRR